MKKSKTNDFPNDLSSLDPKESRVENKKLDKKIFVDRIKRRFNARVMKGKIVLRDVKFDILSLSSDKSNNKNPKQKSVEGKRKMVDDDTNISLEKVYKKEESKKLTGKNKKKKASDRIKILSRMHRHMHRK